MMGRFASQLRNLPKKCADAVGISVTVGRQELVAGSPQQSYGLDDGHEGYDPQGAVAFNLIVVPSPIDLSVLPGELIGMELCKFRGPTEECAFPPTRNMTLTINEGPEVGTIVKILHVGRSVAGASYDIYTAVGEGSAGVLSSGAES